MELLIVAFSLKGFLKGLMFVFFILLAFLLNIVVLLQEPKGGGLSAAFGGAGQETFGVQASGVNKFTAWVAGIWMFLAVLYAAIPQGERVSASAIEKQQEIDWDAVPGINPGGAGSGGSGDGGNGAKPGDG